MTNELYECQRKVAAVINGFVSTYGPNITLHYKRIRKEILIPRIGKLHPSFQEADMCYNQVTSNNVMSYLNTFKLFEIEENGYYRLLGEHCPYSGDVIWHRKRKDTLIVGKWTNGSLFYYGHLLEPGMATHSGEMRFGGQTNFQSNQTKYSRRETEPSRRSNYNIRPEMTPANNAAKSAYQQHREFDVVALQKIDEYLKSHGIADVKNEKNAVSDRLNGKAFSFEDHLRGLIYALLTNQRKWSDVEPKLSRIDQLFFQYDRNEIKHHSGEYFETGIRKLKCGNISIHMQMNGLQHDIEVLEALERRYGSLDRFVTSSSPDTIAGMLSSPSSSYKIIGMGNALAREYLRNVGIDDSKPDTHLKRFFGYDRMGVSRHSVANDQEVTNKVRKLASTGPYNSFEIDYLIWCYCASGKAEICSNSPQCMRCVIREYCNRT